jgi:hypothetical protein
MPPELLGRFYEAYCQGLADFVNGSRLLYPMEGEARQRLNRLGNVFFAKGLSFVLGNRLSDSLWGTKLVARHDYARCVAWRRDFDDFDPFGDYKLLFPASIFALGIVDVPIRYRARTYGATSISRFRHGAALGVPRLFSGDSGGTRLCHRPARSNAQLVDRPPDCRATPGHLRAQHPLRRAGAGDQLPPIDV